MAMEQLQQIAALFHAPAFAAVDSRTLLAMGLVGFNRYRIAALCAARVWIAWLKRRASA
jgi:hypothetical protein